MNPPSTKSKASRIEGLDVARALAICGMVVVHFMLVMTDGQSPKPWSDFLLYVLDGRPAATFVILAGIGVTLMARKVSASTATNRPTLAAILRRRGLVLLVLGFINLLIWPGDILRLYGVSLLIAPWSIGRSSHAVLLAAGGFVLAFGILFLTVDYSRNWDWATMKYHGLWTAPGLVRNLFYDGFRSIFPWTGLLFFGVWLGRLDWSTPRVPRRAVLWGLGLLVGSAVLSRLLLHWSGLQARPGFTPEDAEACFGLRSMPPLPLFLLNATGCALLLIGTCIPITRRWPEWWAFRALAATGRLAFTWYVTHIVLGLGGIILLGWTQTSHGRALFTALAFFSVAVGFSLWWSRRFANGPLEFVLRRVGQGKNSPK